MIKEKLLSQAIQMLQDQDMCHWSVNHDRVAIEALRAALAQPELVAVWELEEDGWDTIADPEWMETLPVGTKLYTASPQRKPLSDEEIMDRWITVMQNTKGTALPIPEFARAIEAAHGIK